MKFRQFLSIYGRTISLVAALAAGILLPEAAAFSAAVPYLIIIMLFFAFVGVKISLKSFRVSMLLLLAANLAVGFLGYLILLPFNRSLALVAFMTGITPSATASPVITGFLGGKVEYTAAVMLLTNVTVALILPAALPAVLGAAVTVSTWDVLKSVLVMVFIPFLLSRLITLLPKRQFDFFVRVKPFSFGVWIVGLVLITARASAFIRADKSVSPHMLIAVALTSLTLCAVNFSLGWLIGRPAHAREGSQSLGQKNTTLTLWLSLAFINPLVAMGPAFYILYHNLWNSIQLYQVNRKGSVRKIVGK